MKDVAESLLIMAKDLLSDDGGSKVEEIEEIEPQESSPIKERRHHEAAVKVKSEWNIRDSGDDAILICKLSGRNKSTDDLVDSLHTVDIGGTGQLRGFGYDYDKVKWTINANEIIGTWFIHGIFPSSDMREKKEIAKTFLRAVR